MINSRFVAIFRRTIDDAAERLLRLTDADVSVQPAPGKWSRKEIIGHLIDSAANNHCRFVRAQLQDDLVFPGYDQDDWVRVQRYRERAWPDLVQLWHSYNHHIAGIMETADVDALRRPRPRHNLHQLAWRPVPESVATTLEDFMNDYVEHLKHHLRQASVL